MIQLNKSSFGLTPQNPGIQFPTPIMPGSSAQTSVPMSVTPNMVNPGDPNANLQVSPNQCNSESTQTQRAFHVSRAPQVAIKNPHLQGQNSVFYFQMLYQVYVLLKPSNLDTQTFQAKWGQTAGVSLPCLQLARRQLLTHSARSLSASAHRLYRRPRCKTWQARRPQMPSHQNSQAMASRFPRSGALPLRASLEVRSLTALHAAVRSEWSGKKASKRPITRQ